MFRFFFFCICLLFSFCSIDLKKIVENGKKKNCGKLKTKRNKTIKLNCKQKSFINEANSARFVAFKQIVTFNFIVNRKKKMNLRKRNCGHSNVAREEEEKNSK